VPCGKARLPNCLRNDENRGSQVIESIGKLSVISI
jgi:hypothetical protein